MLKLRVIRYMEPSRFNPVVTVERFDVQSYSPYFTKGKKRWVWRSNGKQGRICERITKEKLEASVYHKVKWMTIHNQPLAPDELVAWDAYQDEEWEVVERIMGPFALLKVKR